MRSNFLILISFILFNSTPLSAQDGKVLLELSSYSISASRQQHNDSRSWIVRTLPDLNAETATIQFLPLNPSAPLMESQKEFGDVYRLAGHAVKHFIEGNSNEEIEQKISDLTGLSDLDLENFTPEITVHYLDNGYNKIVFLVSFNIQNSSLSPHIILKISKSITRSSKKGLQHHRIVASQSEGLVPKLGDIYEGKTGLAYFEEYISGEPLPDLSSHQVLPPELRNLVVKTTMQIYKVSGKIPRDFNMNNFLVTNVETDKAKAIMIDFDDPVYRTPGKILEGLLAHFGVEPWVVDSSYSEWRLFKRILMLFAGQRSNDKSYIKDKGIFLTVIDILGNDQGISFLQKGLETFQKKYPSIWNRLSRSFPHARWRLNNLTGWDLEMGKLKRNVQFAEFVQNLKRFLNQYDR